MAQHDYNIANQSGAAFRQDLNNALAAIVSNNSGAVEPSTTYAYQFWADTTAGVLKQRNAANSAWVTLFQLDGEWTTIALENGTAVAPSLYFKDSGTDTGVYSAGTDQVAVTTGGVQRVNFNGSTEVVFNDTGADVDFRVEGDTDSTLFVVDAGTDQVRVKNLNGGQLAGMRNRIINGAMTVDQRNNGASQSLSPGLKYTADRWFVNATGGTVTGQRGTGASANQFQYTITGAAGVTSVVFGQRIEAVNSADLAGKTITISCTLITSALTSVSWQLQRANSDDDFSGVTSIASGTFTTVPGSPARQSAQVTLPASATTGLQIVLTTGAMTSGTLSIRDFQLEEGTNATPFERRSYAQELALCQRYYEVGFSQGVAHAASATSVQRANAVFKVTKRVYPSVTTTYTAGAASSPVPVSIYPEMAAVGFTSTASSQEIAFSYTASAEL